MHLFELEALGTHWAIESLDTPFSKTTLKTIHSYIKKFQDNYSRFDPESLVSQLNRTKHLSNPSDELRAMLNFALKTYQQTGGIFNISVGSRLEQLGYGKQSDSTARISDDLTKDVVLSPEEIYLQPHIRLDFGGFGKGWLIDKLGTLLHQRQHDQFIINGGGDILVHSNSLVELVIEHPLDSTQGIGSISLMRGSLAGSSSNKRVWQHNGKLAHHIIDPVSGASTSQAASVHVYAPTALIADTIATVLLLTALPEHRTFLAKAFAADYLVVDNALSYYMSAGFPVTMFTE